MSRTFQRAGGALLATLALAGAAQAQTFHNLYFAGNQPNNLTSVIRTLDDGYIATDNLQAGASLVKLKIDGDIEWVWRYGHPTAPLHAEQVRQNHETKNFVWTGQHFKNGQPIEPFLVSVDPSGQAVKWARKILFTYPAQVNDLEIGKSYKNYWIGGTAEPGAQDEAPWMARYQEEILNGSLHVSLKWARRFQFPESAQLLSLIPTADGGAIGVGQMMEAFGAAAPVYRPRMLAFKVTDSGAVAWAWRYSIPSVETATSEQWLSDLSFSGQNLFVTGTVTKLCSAAPPAACAPRPSTIFAAHLDPMTGDLTRRHALFPKDGNPVRANTIAGAISHVGIGGWLRKDGGEQALLLKARITDNGVSLLEGMLYGDGSGPYQSAVEDVARTGTTTNEPGFVFVTRQALAPIQIQRPAIVRTDENLSAQQGFHCCESPVALDSIRVQIERKGLEHEPREADDIDFDLRAEEPPLESGPCTELPTPGIDQGGALAGARARR